MMNGLIFMSMTAFGSLFLAATDAGLDFTPEGLVARYGVLGLAAALVGGCLWALKRLVNNVIDSQAARLEADRQLAAVVARWCQMLNERPCLQGHKAITPTGKEDPSTR